jgi:hypothetical protein
MMKKISNREEANKYYKLVNNAINDFMGETKARPSEVHKYLTKNGVKFLKKLELSDVEGIDSVLNDVLLHRRHMEDDKVITFESFSKLNESSINVGSPSIEHEKILADVFNTSLGHIDVLDPQLHLFKISDFGKDVYAIIFNESEIGKVKEDLKVKIGSEISSKVMQISDVEGITIDPIKFWISDILDETKLFESINSKISSEMVFNFIKSSLFESPSLNFDLGRFDNFKEYSGYFIWSSN